MEWGYPGVGKIFKCSLAAKELAPTLEKVECCMCFMREWRQWGRAYIIEAGSVSRKAQ